MRIIGSTAGGRLTTAGGVLTGSACRASTSVLKCKARSVIVADDFVVTDDKWVVGRAPTPKLLVPDLLDARWVMVYRLCLVTSYVLEPCKIYKVEFCFVYWAKAGQLVVFTT